MVIIISSHLQTEDVKTEGSSDLEGSAWPRKSKAGVLEATDLTAFSSAAAFPAGEKSSPFLKHPAEAPNLGGLESPPRFSAGCSACHGLCLGRGQ